MQSKHLVPHFSRSRPPFVFFNVVASVPAASADELNIRVSVGRAQIPLKRLESRAPDERSAMEVVTGSTRTRNHRGTPLTSNISVHSHSNSDTWGGGGHKLTRV